MPSFSNTLEQSIHSALALANVRKHTFSTLEHFLLALIDEPDALHVLKACGVDVDALRETLVEFLDDDLSALISDEQGSEADPTAAFQRVIQRAAIHVQSSGRTEVTGANVLVAIFAERESNAAYFLQEQDMTRGDAVNFIVHGVAKNPAYGEMRGLPEFDELEGLEPAPFLEEERLTEAEWRERFGKASKGPTGKDKTIDLSGESSTSARVHRGTLAADSFVFVSYSSLDREMVGPFRSLVERPAIKTWWDQDISPGAEWRAEIAAKLEAANVVLTLWTANSAISKGVIEEASTAQEQRKLVHVKMDDSAMPYGFGETQYVDLKDWDGTENHPSFQRLIYAIKDKLAAPAVEFVSRRIQQSSPIEVVANDGRLSLKDSPANMPSQVVNPADLHDRLTGLEQSLSSMCKMCSNTAAFQLPHTLHHCLEALDTAVKTKPVTWYALEDAKLLLTDCMMDSYASETWNVVVFRGLTKLVARVDEIRPLLQPMQFDPKTKEAKPPAPEPIIREDQVSEVASVAERILAELSSQEGRDTLADNTKHAVEGAVAQIKELEDSTDASDVKLSKLRRAVKGIAYVTGGIITAVGAGVVVNFLTAPSAAITLLARLKPMFDSILQLFF